MNFTYEQLVLRNDGYVHPNLQKHIKSTKLLIAGCGIGSTIAEAAVRLGFNQFILADGDTVELHNLNRQAFAMADVGTPKVHALALRLKAINPQCAVEEQNVWVTKDNVDDLVKRSDLIFDTIDFLDLATITYLHDAAHRQKKPIISAVSVGWGAAGIYFPPSEGESCGFRKLFGLPAKGDVANASYVQHFGVFLQRVSEHLDETVNKAMAKAILSLQDGIMCPAPQVSAGSYGVASLAMTMAARILDGKPTTQSPELILVNTNGVCTSKGIDLTP